MILKMRTLGLAALTIILSACSTMVKPLDSLYWRGKDAYEFFERKRFPDTAVQCVKDNEISFIYGYQLSLYDLQTYEVGRDATTIYMKTDKVYTGGTTWTYLFTDANDKITSVREMTGFGDVEKEFKCDSYQENMNITEDDLKKRKKQARLWSAIYISPEQNMMWASDNPSKQLDIVKQDALRQCQENGGRACQMVVAFSNTCLAFSHGYKNGKGFDTFGNSLDRQHAEYTAVRNCEKKGGDNCKLSAPAICSVPCDILSNNQCMFDETQVIVPGLNNGQPVSIPLDMNN